MVAQEVKVVQAYPIPVQLVPSGTSGVQAVPFAGQIQKLTLKGFLCTVPVASLKPGEKFQCSFQVPVVRRQVSEPLVVVKYYSHWTGSSASGNQGSIGHLAEFHFTALSPVGQEAISEFHNLLAKAGSK